MVIVSATRDERTAAKIAAARAQRNTNALLALNESMQIQITFCKRSPPARLSWPGLRSSLVFNDTIEGPGIIHRYTWDGL
jgi:hypothetical protein